MKGFLIFLLFLIALVGIVYIAADQGYISFGRGIDQVQITTSEGEVVAKVPIPNPNNPPADLDVIELPATPGREWEQNVQAVLATQAAATVVADRGETYPTLAPTSIDTPTPGPTATPQPVILYLKGDIEGTRNLLAQQDINFADEVVEAGFWYGVAYGEGSSGKINYQAIKTGWFFFDRQTQALGQWLFDKLVPDQEIRTGIQGSGAVIAGYRFEDLIPIEVTPLEEDAAGNPLWKEVPCAEGQPQNAVCYKQPVRVKIKARVCYGLEHVGPDTQFFVVDDASKRAMIYGELITGEPASFRTANGLNVAWADFYTQITQQEHLELAGYRAVENLTEGALHEGLKTLLLLGGWSEVDLQVEIANDWRFNPTYCLDDSPVH